MTKRTAPLADFLQMHYDTPTFSSTPFGHAYGLGPAGAFKCVRGEMTKIAFSRLTIFDGLKVHMRDQATLGQLATCLALPGISLHLPF
jgi:hypothetical protein